LNRILVIRGGAIGDFILTLPALKALRDANPKAQIEILGYKHIAELARDRFYANEVRSVEYAPLAGFFAKDSELSVELNDYFARFDLIISYLYDPDLIFENNLRRGGVKNIQRGPAKIAESDHAARQLAGPIEQLGIPVSDLAAKLYPSTADRQFAVDFLRHMERPIVAVHPGSGGTRKNWPLENWIELGNQLLESGNFRGSILVVAGEADEMQCARLKAIWKRSQVYFVKSLPLPHLAALLEHSVFLGHDSGISHLAAAAGAECILLFGPTDPAVWAPQNKNVRVIAAPDGDLQRIDLAPVREALDQALMRIGIST
jgi:heptosyltransferase-3